MASRRAEDQGHGVLAMVVMDLLPVLSAQRDAGVSQADRTAFLAKSLKAAWPVTREWKYLCSHCDDYGLVMGECPGDATCGRDRRHGPHAFGTPCWCSEGRRYREKPKPEPEDFVAAGKAKKSFSRFGGR